MRRTFAFEWEVVVLLRRSCCCDGAAAATELLLRRSCCCDGAADATRRMMRPAFISPRVDLYLKLAHSPRHNPLPRIGKTVAKEKLLQGELVVPFDGGFCAAGPESAPHSIRSKTSGGANAACSVWTAALLCSFFRQ